MIQIQGLKKTYSKHTVLDWLDLTIPDQSIFALLGPNGSGKTTLIKSILGITQPDVHSQITLDGRYSYGSREFKNHIGYMPQYPKFSPHLKVRELIGLFEKLRQAQAPNRDELIQDLQIDAFWNKAFVELSGGMMQKVNLLQAFMFDVSLFILDEPTAGLDPQIAYYLKNLLLKKKKAGATVLFTSHVMAEVEALADEMALLVEGRIYTVIAPAQLKKNHGALTLEAALHSFWETIKNS